ncbi:MAG: alpha/beta hydrolase [Pseudomonadota bacterium]|nr:alpha/beta hydrolase [Pseudomonadota bacterium]
MPSVTLPSAVVNYSDQGQGAPILLLHANPGEQRDFAAVMEPLTRLGRVIALDWPGFGQSPPMMAGQWVTVEDFYRVLEEFVATLGLKDVVLVGNSLGGNAAVKLAARHPCWVRGLVLVAPGGFTPRNWLTQGFCRLQGSALSLSPYRFARFYIKRKTAVSSAMLARAHDEQSAAEPVALGRALWRSFGQPENDLTEIAPKVRAPCLLVFGAKDPVIRAQLDGERALALLPHAERVILPCGHVAFAELPEPFLQAVHGFMAGLSPPSRQRNEDVTISDLDSEVS